MRDIQSLGEGTRGLDKAPRGEVLQDEQRGRTVQDWVGESVGKQVD